MATAPGRPGPAAPSTHPHSVSFHSHDPGPEGPPGTPGISPPQPASTCEAMLPEVTCQAGTEVTQFCTGGPACLLSKPKSVWSYSGAVGACTCQTAQATCPAGTKMNACLCRVEQADSGWTSTDAQSSWDQDSEDAGGDEKNFHRPPPPPCVFLLCHQYQAHLRRQGARSASGPGCVRGVRLDSFTAAEPGPGSSTLPPVLPGAASGTV